MATTVVAGDADVVTAAEHPAPDVDVVIVSYHSRDLVLAAIASATAESAVSVEVVVVDNDSCDGTVESVRATCPGVAVLEQGANTGFARAVNRGVAASRGRYVMLLNPDAVLAAGALEQLLAFAESRPGVGVVAPALRNADGTPQHTARAFPRPAAALFGRRSALTRLLPGNRWSRAFLTGREHDGSEPFRADWVSGAAMLVPRAVIDRVGGLDEDFFLFWEDADWCRRIGDAGFQVWCVPAAVVVHDEGGTRDHGWSPRTIRWFHQGAYRYWVKHEAPQRWSPTRWLAAALLGTRAAALTVGALLRSTPPAPVPPSPGHPLRKAVEQP